MAFVNLWFISPGVYYPRALNSILTQLSLISTGALATMILGCIVAFISTNSSGRNGRLLIFSAGTAFCLAAIVFILGFVFISNSAGGISYSNPLSLSSPSSGFYMAFVAATPAFLSLATRRSLILFSLGWGALTTALTVIFMSTSRGPYAPGIYTAMFVSFIFMCIATFIGGIMIEVYRSQKNKETRPSAHAPLPVPQ